jgi:hypothetical protein
MSKVRELMEYAEEKLRTENPSFCLNEVMADERFNKSTIGSISSMMTQLTVKGGLVREMKSCPLSKRDHWHYKFNRKPERSSFKKSISKNILEFAKDKSDLKEPFFCVHEINKALGIPENNASIAVRGLIKKNKISKLDLKYRCQYSDRVHPFYKYFVAGNKPVEEKPIVPEKTVLPEKPKKKYKYKYKKKKKTYKKKKPEVMQPIQTVEVFQPMPKENDYKKVEVTIEGGKFIIRAEK